MDDRADMPDTAHEARRLGVLREMGILDSGPDPRFDRISRTAATLFRAPMAAVALIDESRVWLKARVGLDYEEIPRAGSLAAVMVDHGLLAISGDLKNDPAFADLIPRPMTMDVRFFGCAPLTAASGERVGALIVADPQAHEPPSQADLEALEDLAALAMQELRRDAETARARARRHLDEQRIRLALKSAGMGEYEWDLRTDTLVVSDRASALTGVPAGRLSANAGEVLRSVVHPDDRDNLVQTAEASLRATGRYEVEYRRVDPDGRACWRYLAGAVVRDADGQPERIIGVVQDIDSRKTEQERLQSLLAELDHRVKNVLAAVQSVAAQSARRAGSLDAFLKTFTGRLKTMASAHDLLTATRWRGAVMGDVVHAQLSGLAPGQTRFEGPEILLTPRAAGALSLALHELAINAVKYGALSVESGRVEVNWRRAPDGGFALEWLETGGPPVSPPTRRGFGSTLFERVSGRELGGSVEVDYRRSGVKAMIRADAAALIEDADLEAVQAERLVDQLSESLSLGMNEPTRITDVQGLKILIVEDSVLLAMELEAGLIDLKAEVVGVAASVEEAMALIDAPMDAAVLDANLDGRSVTPVAEALRRHGVPFVFATGYADRDAPTQFDAPIVRKPYNVGQIAAALAQVTHKGAALREPITRS